MPQRSFYLSDSLINDIAHFAREANITKSDVIRQALISYLREGEIPVTFYLSPAVVGWIKDKAYGASTTESFIVRQLINAAITQEKVDERFIKSVNEYQDTQ